MSGYTRGVRPKAAKDRAAPFSRKHRKYWLTITGGKILIGAINLGLGFCGYEEPTGPPQKLPLVLPHSVYATDGGVTAPLDSADGLGSGSATR